jgi:uncharacterized protein (TIGR03083 family)
VVSVVNADAAVVFGLYQQTRERISALVAGLDDAAVAASVAACPRWTVRDVVAHLTAVAQDWADGSLTGPPTDAQTAAQVGRFRHHDMAEIIAAWSEATVRLDQAAESRGVEPPLGDITSHEHDIRGALGRPGARDSEAVRHSSDRLLGILMPRKPVRVIVEDGQYRCGPPDSDEIVLRTTRFEALRWRTGRRSRGQLAAMDWTGDPTPVLDDLYLFGPADGDVLE